MPLNHLHLDSRRFGAGLITLAIHLTLGLLLAIAFRSSIVKPQEQPLSDPLIRVEAALPPPPRVPSHPPQRRVRHRSAAPRGSPVNQVPILSPPPPAPVPIVALPSPPIPSSAANGIEGGGRGGNGSGDGAGNGPGGNGQGDGGDGTPPRRLSGHISDRDYPRGLSEAGISGTVGVRYRVDAGGKVSDCRVTRSSGHPALDELTCSLIQRRFRFRAALDVTGHPVPSIIVEQHSWIIPAASPDASPRK